MLTDPGGLGELEVIYGSQAHPSQETVSSWQTGFLPEGGFIQQSLSVGLSPVGRLPCGQGRCSISSTLTISFHFQLSLQAQDEGAPQSDPQGASPLTAGRACAVRSDRAPHPTRLKLRFWQAKPPCAASLLLAQSCHPSKPHSPEGQRLSPKKQQHVPRCSSTAKRGCEN